jgi:adenylate cyclase
MSEVAPAILVADDNEDNRYTLTQRLQREGYRDLAIAANGRQALEHLEARPFDLVLLDIMMPELDGMEVLARMKAAPELRHIPVIMISAATDLDWVVRCIELGAEDYLPKPFNRVLLRARIRACLERKRLHDRVMLHIEEIDAQRRRADELLHVILPAPAVSELKASRLVVPRRHDEVVVLFADVIGFTAFCESRPPEAVVTNLDLLVQAFEGLATRHGLEKIKTIGDALMATAGLLLPHDDPVMAGLRCAMACSEAARHLPTPWELRIGVHIGPVVAGIVGREKFSFDIWGDTVNVAARLAACGASSGIYMSLAAWERVQDRAQALSLGPVSMKGKGEMEVLRLAGLQRQEGPTVLPA